MYRVEGATSEQDVVDWVGFNVDATVAGFPFADFTAEEDDEILNEYNVTVEWGQPEQGGGQTIETVEYKFNYQAPSAHVYQSLQTIAAYTDPKFGFSFGPDRFKGSINVVVDGGKYRVEGFNLPAPNETFTLSYKTASLSGAYQALVEGMCGKVNSVAFRGKNAGELMLCRVTGGRGTSGQWYIDYGFAYTANDTNIPVGDIIVTAKDGWDLLWTFYGTGVSSDVDGLVKTPNIAFVERIFKRADFAALALPA